MSNYLIRKGLYNRKKAVKLQKFLRYMLGKKFKIFVIKKIRYKKGHFYMQFV
jgi:hypothetical protein